MDKRRPTGSSDEMAGATLRRLPPPELVQGLSLADLQDAGERAFQRGWDAACAQLEDELEHRLELARVESRRREQNVVNEESWRADRAARKRISDDTEDGRMGVGLAVAHLVAVLKDAPRGLGVARRERLERALVDARRAKRALDRLHREETAL